MRKTVIVFGILATVIAASVAASADQRDIPASDVSAMAVRNAIMGRGVYIPSEREHLVIDQCALEGLLSGAQLDTVIAEVGHMTKFAGCGDETILAADGAVVWKVLDGMTWPRFTMLAVRVSRQGGRTFQQERYTLRDHDYLAELVLSHSGVYD